VPPIDTALAAVLRRLRTERDLSQEAVAHQAGVSYTTLAKIELARSTPGWATVRAIADALGVSLAELAAAVEAQGRQQGLDDQAQKARRR
jgi:transcriptional regulator with XRE-family HTH domain